MAAAGRRAVDVSLGNGTVLWRRGKGTDISSKEQPMEKAEMPELSLL